MRRVLERLYVAEHLPPIPHLAEHRISAVCDATGASVLPRIYRVCRTKGPSVTARGRAVSFIGECLADGERVVVCGADAEDIVRYYLMRVGFGEDDIGKPA